MGQIKSTSLPRVPYSMVWENARVSKYFGIDSILADHLANKYLTMNTNYINCITLRYWGWRNRVSYNTNIVNALNGNYKLSEILKRTLLGNQLKKPTLATRINRGTNLPLVGNSKLFLVNNRLYFVYCFYLHDFETAKKLNPKLSSSNNNASDTKEEPSQLELKTFRTFYDYLEGDSLHDYSNLSNFNQKDTEYDSPIESTVRIDSSTKFVIAESVPNLSSASTFGAQQKVNINYFV